MNQKYLRHILSLIIVVTAFFSWFFLDRAINVTGSSVWVVPISCFAVLFTAIALSFISLKDSFAIKVVVAISFLMSFLFIFDLTRIIFFVIAFLFLSTGAERLKKDLDENIKLNPVKSLNAGKSLILLSLILMIVSQYFSQVRLMQTEALLPQLELGKISNPITSRVIEMINPEFNEMETENLTIDEFILRLQKEQMGGLKIQEGSVDIDKLIESQLNSTQLPAQREQLKQEAKQQLEETKKMIEQQSQQFILEEERERLSEMVGYELTGSEKANDVLTAIVSKRISDYFQPKAGQTSTSLPMVLSIALFLTLLSLANLLYIVLVRLVQFIVYVLVRTHIIQIKKVTMEVEKIA